LQQTRLDSTDLQIISLLARDIYQLVSQLGFNDIFIVENDFGAQVAYSYAAAHPNGMQRLAQNVTGIKVPLSGH
jgi:pimeloyl-ACP methyl ester carboxylesterase